MLSSRICCCIASGVVESLRGLYGHVAKGCPQPRLTRLGQLCQSVRGSPQVCFVHLLGLQLLTLCDDSDQPLDLHVNTEHDRRQGTLPDCWCQSCLMTAVRGGPAQHRSSVRHRNLPKVEIWRQGWLLDQADHCQGLQHPIAVMTALNGAGPAQLRIWVRHITSCSQDAAWGGVDNVIYECSGAHCLRASAGPNF